MDPSGTPVPTPHHGGGTISGGWAVLVIVFAVVFFGYLLWSAYTSRGDGPTGGGTWN